MRGQVVDGDVSRPVEHHVGDALWLMFYQSQQQVDQLVAPLLGKPSDHAELDECDAVAGQVEHIAGMRVSVEVTILNDHLQYRMRSASS